MTSSAGRTGRSLAARIAEELKRRGVARIFGVPGGGSLDLIEAAHAAGIDFVLTRGETAATIMAAVTFELTGQPGVVLTGLGPGAAAAVNGIAQAALDRAAVVLISDAIDPGEAWATHQRLDQPALFRPLVKASWQASTDARALGRLLDQALGPPPGPVHIDLAGRAAAMPVAAGRDHPEPLHPGPVDPPACVRGRALLERAERPLVLIGLEALAHAGAARTLVAALRAPALTTWKAKGVIADDDPYFVGLVTGGTAEADVIAAADLIVMVGLDPVELIPRPWRYPAPVLDLAGARRATSQIEPAVRLIGPLAASIEALLPVARPAGWTLEDVRARRTRMGERHTMAGCRGISPEAVVRTVARHTPPDARAAIDAGAHMFPAIAHFPAREPHAVLISNGLATMGFALPAAIASALQEPARPVVCLVGDGGLAMTLAELATLAQVGGPVVVVVFNDAGLSLIDLKRAGRRLPAAALSTPPIDFSVVARGLGLEAHRIETLQEFDRRLPRALAVARPVLLDVAVDASAYAALVQQLRG
jgi:acetolactate synthase-1/2/3 large subunit